MEAIVKDDLKKEEKKNIATASERPPNRFRLYYCPFWYPFYCRLQFPDFIARQGGTIKDFLALPVFPAHKIVVMNLQAIKIIPITCFFYASDELAP